ncbi:MAG TPA: hypothetical protein PL164_01075 [Candidatus Paceibacterota bacterium]|nr:hypothetical protein [Candidatus Paceibacterota bacterium]HOK97375.1 hypothetical protein [Candidatus Paceibacterota bacterium]HPP64860.1 hypothetical protein [Candidatus Paceibacterota bacterium]
MTIIYDYSNSKKIRRPVILVSSQKYPRKKFHFFSPILDIKKYFGHIKLAVFLLAPLIISLMFWLILYGQNISLDYQIYKVKNEISQTEENLATLQEELADAESTIAINKWAAENHFVPVKNISYLNLKEDNLAQNSLLRF